ncbi:hypothetical protein C1S82_04700 [Mycolicibacterium cosmeticum]|uniref:Uncharacterized protein n=1 Tax=Mycolicibacterium cosmeticum TaxID=258533 RepID=W9AXQ1_MYCCO|nr:hypothetical protein [Mycolicibacterium cosmeticum]TLH80201.1 hypothetical protein C1S82_04700 [Mycolicibacterium cosmeticum]CDO07371.1 hypothetical protein BN977_02178 [Mycolicibacterium cosmeticum]
MAEAAFWVAWGLPTRGRETNALGLLKKSRDYLQQAAQDGRIERFETVILRPQSPELGGFFLIQGSTGQIDALRRDADFETWVNQVQLVADRVAAVDAWVDAGIDEAIGLYEDALREAGLSD